MADATARMRVVERLVFTRGEDAVELLVERFGWRGTEPFELLRSEFGQNLVEKSE